VEAVLLLLILTLPHKREVKEIYQVLQQYHLQVVAVVVANL
tara:strand:+ start:233 stop:355 length:123 start_codon:yes stop_codon:yes gene_type:complete